MTTALARQRVTQALRRPLRCALGLAAAASVAGGHAAGAASSCSVRSGVAATPVVELYTSEGCSSCPPADRWLASLKGRSDVVALAFHVDYWDRLGWVDRFASPAFTQRQVQQQAVNGARFAYTPQVVIDGHDRKDWAGVRVAAPSTPAPVSIELTREGDEAVARVRWLGNTPSRLAAYWALTEFDHRSAVKAGENQGTTLSHEFVVRELQSVPAWAGTHEALQTLRFAPHSAADPAHPRRLSLVVTDAASGRPVQAVSLGC